MSYHDFSNVCYVKNLPVSSPVIKDLYDVVFDPKNIIVMAYLIDEDKAPILAIHKSVRAIYDKHELSDVERKNTNILLGRMLSYCLELFQFFPSSDCNVKAYTKGLITKSTKYEFRNAGDTWLVDSNHQIVKVYPAAKSKLVLGTITIEDI